MENEGLAPPEGHGLRFCLPQFRALRVSRQAGEGSVVFALPRMLAIS